MPANFIFEKQAAITTITFNRPERRNCVNEEVIFDFEELLHKVRDDRETRALIVTGTGNAFCSGADLSMVKKIDDREQRREFSREVGKRVPRLIGRAFDVLANLDCVTIGAINGYAVGGGWSLALALDFCFAVEAAEFWVPEVDMAVPYRGAPAKVLAARLGPWRAKEAILQCRHYTANELFALGVVNRVVKPDELMPAAIELAHTMAAKSAEAIANSKRDINGFFLGQRLF
ncbi:MAG TPA: enoyl-CoA hydratase/isomerase family protein [Candidatus Binataceae bacterium]|nr:enoyl-CoA hydratase/isomerase family protein [Candidatus Binataceae bacterium]